ncbi:hypothetical protein F4779DRAFT_157219 [Xylariaceae sp. FL0662B]|nr:hypothetical protein F4779DRAFT_157219 [Xylariaceae sp. FL0662B]
MMSSHSKTARTRFSSPLHLSSSPSGHNRGLTSEGQRTFLQRWLEPPVQNKASFQEAGLMRGGVVENMAPLGTLPKTAMHKKSPINGETSTPTPKTRIVLKKSSATPAIPSEPASVRAPTPAPVSVSASAATMAAMQESLDAEPAEAAPLSPLSRPVLHLPAMDDGEDDDYVPKKSKARRSSHINSAPSSNTRRHSNRRKSARLSPTPVRSSPVHSSSPFHATPSTLIREPEDKDLADKVVELAVDEALRHYRYPTAWALRLLYDENSSDPHFVSMIEDIYFQRADSDTLQEFNRLIHEKKKDGKKDNKGCYYFVPPPTGSRFTPHKPRPAPYADLIKIKMNVGIKENDGAAATDGHDHSRSHDHDHSHGHTQSHSHGHGHGHISKKVKLEGDHPKAKAKANGVGSHHGHKRTASHKSPRGKKTRSGSMSSTSSLSSVPDDMPDDYEEFLDRVDDGLGLGVARASPMEAEPNKAQIPTGSVRPISGHQKQPATKKQKVSPDPAAGSASQNTTTPTQPTSPARDPSMPATLVAHANTNGAASSHLHDHHQPSAALKFASRFGDLNNSDSYIQKKLDKKFENATSTKRASGDSFIRNPLGPGEELQELAVPPPPPAAVAAEQNRASRTPVLSSRAARAAKRNHDELDRSVSPTTLSFRADLESSSARNSRAATPSNLRSTKKPRPGLRVKTSPMKKKGTSAGIPRGSGEQRPSPVGNGAPNNQDDNDDSCYTCGGNGELVCCDGCHYSFHFLCIDPPMDEGHIPDEWYCNECTQRYFPSIGEQRGAFGSLLHALERKNPRAFRLPEDVRDHFEGVRTGAEGEYEEIAPPKPKSNKKLDEPFDFFKLRNADGPVLCHHCHKAATDNRPIVPCSVCGLNWHLECLDPPLAVPPVPRTWRCPCHVDEVLSEFPERLAPAHRYRKVKNAPVIEQSYSRGLANNGWIEIEEDSDDDEDVDAWRQHKGFGRVHRLSAKGIKLDFIDRVHQNRRRAQAEAGPTNPAFAATPTARSIEAQQAALNLAQLAQGSGEGANQLVQAMLSEASPTVVSMMAAGDALRISTGNLINADHVALQAMLAQAENLTKNIAKILKDRRESTAPDGAADIATPATLLEQQPLTPNGSLRGDSAVVKDEKSRASSPRISPEEHEAVHAMKSIDNSTMQID